PLGTKSDKSAADATTKPATTSETKLELRSTVGHADIPASLREQTHTADASGAMTAASSPTMSDATSARALAASGDEAANTEVKPEATKSDEAKSAEVTTGEAKPAGADKTTSEAAKPE